MRSLVSVLTLAAALGWLAVAAAEPNPATKPLDYQRDVLPILQTKCVRCHKPMKADGKLDLSTRAAMLKGGISGPAIEPGKPDKSLMVELVHFNEMPPKRVQPRVTKDELKLLKDWIAAVALEK